MKDPAHAPDPGGGWSASIRGFDNALIVPAVTRGELVQPCGVFAADGSFIKRGVVWRRGRPINTPPERPLDPVGRLAGSWLWGGILYGHFGHFLVESTARLWALPQLRGVVDGVVFAARNPNDPPDLSSFQSEVLRLMIGDTPVRLTADPLAVDRLEVPGQGFGLGVISTGTDEFRSFIETDFARDIAPDGPPDLFISRSGLRMRQGGFVGESILDARMEAAGYDVFHPEQHDIATQIARYKAARRVVAIDGSALHLYAMVARAPQRAAVILRRRSGLARGLLLHLRSFTGAKPLVIDSFSGEHKALGGKGLITDLDLTGVGAALHAGGFIDPPAPWGPLSPVENDLFEVELTLAQLVTGQTA
jgi:hypothetical protein